MVPRLFTERYVFYVWCATLVAVAKTGTYLETGRMFDGGTVTTAMSGPEMAVLTALEMAKSNAEKARQADADVRVDAYEDDYSDVLRERISETF